MAQTKSGSTAKKKTTAAKSATKSKSSSAASKKAPVQEKKDNVVVKRGVAAVVCFLLSLFSFIGYFDVDAWFITYFCGFIKGILGVGYYIFPPALLVCTCTLVFGNGKNLWWRIVSALLMPLMLGSFCHLFLVQGSLEFVKGFISDLYLDGKLMSGGGLIGGVLAIGLTSAVSVYGAYPVFILGFVFFAMNGVGLTIPKLINDFKESRAAAKEAPEANPAVPVNQARHMSEAKSPSPAAVAEKLNKQGLKAIDIPVDEPLVPVERYKEEKVGFFNKNPRVRTPDQVLSDTDLTHSSAKISPLSAAEAAGAAESASVVSSESAKPSSPAKKISHEEVEAETKEITKSIEAKEKEPEADNYSFPSIDLLKTAGRAAVDGREEISLNRERLESTIRSFGVSG
ncbi:MAG: hypothetical protein EOM14_13400, partial [Clostridia bacterium]|nr:hypothetical protein [Clostridia bacterium]